MPKTKKSFNPFYLLLLLTGTAFAVTAMAYGVMTVRFLHASRMVNYPSVHGTDSSSESGDPTEFDHFMAQKGTQLLVAELVLLSIATIGAIGYDQYVDGQSATQQPPESETSS